MEPYNIIGLDKIYSQILHDISWELEGILFRKFLVTHQENPSSCLQKTYLYTIVPSLTTASFATDD